MTVDELIEKYQEEIDALLELCDNKLTENGSIVLLASNRQIIQDLETLKAELKEQYKKDVMEAYNIGLNDEFASYDDGMSQAEQYYNENH